MLNPLSWLARASFVATVAFASAAVPASANSGSKTTQVAYRIAGQDPVLIDRQELSCMTEALYYEARGEGTAGQRAVAEVILNRVDHPRFPKSVCGVVNQRGQFSYHGRVTKNFRDRGAYERVKRVAASALAGAPRDLTNGATYFHTRAVRPNWSNRFTRTARIGAHVFYRTGGGQRLASN